MEKPESDFVLYPFLLSSIEITVANQNKPNLTRRKSINQARMFGMHRFFVGFLFAVTLLLTTGCGGGGGGPSNLNYITNWSATDAGGISGASQRVAMYSLDGALLSSAVLNNPGGSLQSFQFFLPNGSYHLSVELYSLANLGGTKVGTIDTIVAINGSSNFRTEVGATIVGAQVTPASSTFQVQTSKQFYAAVTAASGHVTFSDPNGFTWQAFGGHVTVGETGLALATSEGAGSIRATHVLTGSFGTATYTITPLPTFGLNYITEWMTSSGGVTGASQRVAVRSLEGAQLSSVVLNNPGGGIQNFEFELPNGTYHLSMQLYALANLGGTKTGELDAIVVVNGATTYRSEVGPMISGLDVTPPSASFQVQTSKQFYANVKSASGRATFSEPNGFTWQAFGGHVTVGETGLALATSEGTGSIRATHGLSGEFNSATYTIEPFATTTTKWTVLVYINAANDLYPFSTLNMNQMEAVAQNPEVRFVVQWKQSQTLFPSSSFNGTRRYLVKPDTTNQIASQLVQNMGSGVDMGQHSTLLDFVNWGQTYFPGTRTCLIVWNHGNGWRRRPAADEPISRAVSYDDETGNAIQIWQLGQALGSNHFDILAWDASLMQMLEVAYEVEDQASYVVGSEESPPGEGYPYDLIFQQFRDNPDNSTAILTKAFVDGMLAVPSYATRKITQSVLDTSKLDDLSNAISSLGTALQANAVALSSDTITIRNQSQSYSPTSSRVFRDLIDICDRYLALSGLPSDVQTAAQNTKSAALAALVWEGHNSHSPGSKGISIDFSSGTTFAPSAADYANLKLAQLTQWNEWLTVAP